MNRTVKNSLISLSKVRLSLLWFPWNSQTFNKYLWTLPVPNVAYIWQKQRKHRQNYIYTLSKVWFSVDQFSRNSHSVNVGGHLLCCILSKSGKNTQNKAKFHLHPKQSVIFSSPIFMELTSTRQHYVEIYYTEYISHKIVFHDYISLYTECSKTACHHIHSVP